MVLGAEFCVCVFFFFNFKSAGLLPTPVADPLRVLSVSLKTKLFGFCIGLRCWLCPAPLPRQGKPRRLRLA